MSAVTIDGNVAVTPVSCEPLPMKKGAVTFPSETICPLTATLPPRNRVFPMFPVIALTLPVKFPSFALTFPVRIRFPSPSIVALVFPPTTKNNELADRLYPR